MVNPGNRRIGLSELVFSRTDCQSVLLPLNYGDDSAILPEAALQEEDWQNYEEVCKAGIRVVAKQAQHHCVGP